MFLYFLAQKDTQGSCSPSLARLCCPGGHFHGASRLVLREEHLQLGCGMGAMPHLPWGHVGDNSRLVFPLVDNQETAPASLTAAMHPVALPGCEPFLWLALTLLDFLVGSLPLNAVTAPSSSRDAPCLTWLRVPTWRPLSVGFPAAQTCMEGLSRWGDGLSRWVLE